MHVVVTGRQDRGGSHTHTHTSAGVMFNYVHNGGGQITVFVQSDRND